MDRHDIIVIGSSAGGIGVMQELVTQFDKEIPASLFWVHHLSPHNGAEMILAMVQQKARLTCRIPENGEAIKRGYLYLAPADHHLILTGDKMIVNKGPKESRSRPSIDVLFRSAAANFDSRVIGVLLSGLLDDGVSGMEAIKRSGGRTVVQHPHDAPYGQLPQCALDHVDIDYNVPISEMGYVIEGLIYQPTKESFEIPPDIKLEAEIAARMITDIDTMKGVGNQLPYECPTCGGGLWETPGKYYPHLRCHTGHSFTFTSLYEEKSKRIEEALYVALRMLEERRNMFLRLMREEKRKTNCSQPRFRQTMQPKCKSTLTKSKKLSFQ